MALINKKQEYQDQEAWSNDVQKLKGYKEFKEKVEWWAEQKNKFNWKVIRGPYEIVWDENLYWCVDVRGDIEFSYSCITEIPFQFRNVDGYFSCNYCKNLTSLKGCPVYINGSFSCVDCDKLTSLECCPKEVGSSFHSNYKFKEEYIRSLCDVKGDIYNGGDVYNGSN